MSSNVLNPECPTCQAINPMALAAGQIWTKTVEQTQWTPPWRKIIQIQISYDRLFVVFVTPRSRWKIKEYKRRAVDVRQRVKRGYRTTPNTYPILHKLERQTDRHTVDYRTFLLWIKRNKAVLTNRDQK